MADGSCLMVPAILNRLCVHLQSMDGQEMKREPPPSHWQQGNKRAVEEILSQDELEEYIEDDPYGTAPSDFLPQSQADFTGDDSFEEMDTTTLRLEPGTYGCERGELTGTPRRRAGNCPSLVTFLLEKLHI